MAPVDVLRRWSLIPAAIGCLAIAAFASRSTASGFESGIPDVDLFTGVEVAGYVALGVGIVLLPWVVLERARRRLRADPARRAAGEPRRVPIWATALALVVVGGLAVLQASAIVTFLRTLFLDPATTGLPGLGGPGAGELDPLATVRHSPALGIALVILVALAVLAIGVVLVWRRQDAAERDQGDQPRRIALRESVELGLDALRSEPDPRLAVIAAYAAMERSMSTVGLGRVSSEAPVEYLRRITAAVPAAEDAATISQLFQVARFSVDPVDEAMRQDAIAALERVRAALTPGAAGPASPLHQPAPTP